jgi:hypothetical protein
MRRAWGGRLVIVASLGLLGMLSGGCSPASPRAWAQAVKTERPAYRVEFRSPRDELIGDLERTERGDPRLEGEIGYSHWYTRKTFERWHGWGPPARQYPPLPGIAEWPLERKRERAIAVALRFVGYGYQHHHIPDWDPPADWTWKPTCVGRNGKGFDCSNFTSFVFNLGFGLRLGTEVHHQSEQRHVEGPAPGRRVPIRLISLPAAYPDRIQTLRTGDLVYIRNREDRISHVVLWIGSIGRAPGDIPLIIDSHGDEVRDDQGVPIPCGVQLRPFREHSWYNKSASHALRILDEAER